MVLGSSLLRLGVWVTAALALLLLVGAGRANPIYVTAQMSSAPSVSAKQDGSTKLAVHHEDGQTFKLLRGDFVPVRVTFLNKRTVHIQTLGNERGIDLPDYIRIKSDRSYPRVAIDWETRDSGATFKTGEMTVDLDMERGGTTIQVIGSQADLITNWQVNAERRQLYAQLAAAGQKSSYVYWVRLGTSLRQAADVAQAAVREWSAAYPRMPPPTGVVSGPLIPT